MKAKLFLMVCGWLLMAVICSLIIENKPVVALGATVPNWTVDRTLYAYDGEVTGEVFIDDVAVTGGNGILAAFAGDECRGVKTGGFTGPSGKYVFIIRCYSNVESGELLTFKYFDPVTEKIHSVDESYSFESNGILGDARDPVPLHIYTRVRISRRLSAGWSWFSVNVEESDMSVATVLGSLNPVEGDYIKNQTVSSTWYDGAGWFGELTTMDTKEMYKIKLRNADTLSFAGFPIDSGSFSIDIKNGWNWIGYLPQALKTVDDALSSISPVENDYIKDQIASSTYYYGAGWFGEMVNLEPLNGYMLKTSHTGTLTFASPLPGAGIFTDSRDGRVYKTIIIGTQTWMAENLAYLPAVSPSETYSFTNPNFYVNGYEGVSVSDAKATDNFGTYGVLYNWPAAMAACPAGWHLPSDEEWKVLEMNQGMSQADADAVNWRNTGTVGGKLKEAGTTHWNYPNTGATNRSGFTALPGGVTDGGGYNYPGNYTYFWSASGSDAMRAWRRDLSYEADGVSRYNSERIGGFSVRCVQNN